MEGNAEVYDRILPDHDRCIDSCRDSARRYRLSECSVIESLKTRKENGMLSKEKQVELMRVAMEQAEAAIVWRGDC